MANVQKIQAWIEALKSSRYKQGHGVLRDSADGHCCLGVAADVCFPNTVKWVEGEYGGYRLHQLDGGPSHNTDLPAQLAAELGLDKRIDPGSFDVLDGIASYVAGRETPGLSRSNNHRQSLCMDLNDNLGFNFYQIADFLTIAGWTKGN